MKLKYFMFLIINLGMHYNMLDTREQRGKMLSKLLSKEEKKSWPLIVEHSVVIIYDIIQFLL
jgi:hypothetical protein